MATPKLKLTIEQGSTFRKSFTWKAGVPLSPVNLTGCTARMHIREEVDNPNILLSLTTEDSRIVLGGALGTISLYLPASITAGITWLTAVYDLEIISPASPEPDVSKLFKGDIVVIPEVTR